MEAASEVAIPSSALRGQGKPQVSTSLRGHILRFKPSVIICVLLNIRFDLSQCQDSAAFK
jgi:hypothetical protein